MPKREEAEESNLSDPPNYLAGVLPLEIGESDFAELEEGARSALYGRGDWLVGHPLPDNRFSLELDKVDITKAIEGQFMEYAPLINPALRCNLINWLDLVSTSPEGGFGEALAMGLKNIPTHGNSCLRQAAAESLAHLTCLDRFHDGDGGVCRIWVGTPIQLDDCTCQQVSIGKLHFTAADFGGAIHLGEFLQRKMVPAERSEKNQCTLLSVAAGLLHAESVSSNLPARNRVAHTATELRTAEWQTAAPPFDSLGAAKSFREKSIVSLRHDIVHPNHDRGYRSLGLFLPPF